MEQYAVLIEVVGSAIKDYTDRTLRILKYHWDSCLTHSIAVVLAMAANLPKMEFRLFFGDVMPLMLATIYTERNSGYNRPRTVEVLNCMGRLRSCLSDHFNQVCVCIGRGESLFTAPSTSPLPPPPPPPFPTPPLLILIHPLLHMMMSRLYRYSSS